MKNIKSISVIIVLVSLIVFGCGTDKSQLLIGKWKEVETGESICNYNADGTFVNNLDNGKTEKGKWRIKGNELYITYEGDEELPGDEIAQLDENNLVVVIAGMFQTKYERVK